MIESKLILTSLTIWSVILLNIHPGNGTQDFNRKEIKSIQLIKIQNDQGNLTRHVLEMRLDRKRFQDFIDDLNSSEIEKSYDVTEKFYILITTKKDKQIRLVGQDMILLNKENSKYYKADFNWTIKYWGKDLSKGGF